MSTSTVKILQYRQDELTGTSAMLTAESVLLWTPIWSYRNETCPPHRCHQMWSRILAGQQFALGLHGRTCFDAFQILLAEMHLQSLVAAWTVCDYIGTAAALCSLSTRRCKWRSNPEWACLGFYGKPVKMGFWYVEMVLNPFTHPMSK